MKCLISHAKRNKTIILFDNEKNYYGCCSMPDACVVRAKI